MNRTDIVIVTGGVALAAAAAWAWMRPLAPLDTPYFHWERGAGKRYELVIRSVAGNPEFRAGVLTTPVPQSGTLRVVGTADPGAIVEVSNARTRRGFAVTAAADGTFSVDAEALRGDTLKVVSRRIRFRPLEPPRYSSSSR